MEIAASADNMRTTEKSAEKEAQKEGEIKVSEMEKPCTKTAGVTDSIQQVVQSWKSEKERESRWTRRVKTGKEGETEEGQL